MEPKKEFLIETIKEAGKLVLDYFGKVENTSHKESSIDVLTEVDLKSEKLIIDKIKKEYPSHGIISEESDDYNTNSEYVWVIDPIDGTLNFSRKIPVFRVIIGIMKNKEMVMSAIYLPFTEELFFAKKGEGAYLNDEKISCSQQKTINESLLVSNSVLDKETVSLTNKVLETVDNKKIISNAFCCAAASFSYLACGRNDWSITRNFTLWDIAPGVLLCEEAGLKIKFLDGSDFDPFRKDILLIANPILYKEIEQIIK